MEQTQISKHRKRKPSPEIEETPIPKNDVGERAVEILVKITEVLGEE